MIRRWVRTIAATLGAAIWVFSPMVTGRVEPWDASGPYYWMALLVSGFVVGGIEPEKFLTTSLWVVAGQALAIIYGIFFDGRDIGLFFPMGFIALLLLSAPCYLGAFLGSRLALSKINHSIVIVAALAGFVVWRRGLVALGIFIVAAVLYIAWSAFQKKR